MKKFVKKYWYLGNRKMEDWGRQISKRIQYFVTRVDPFSIDPLETSKLSFPAHWEEFDRKSLVVEIGTGHGELLQFLSQKHPDKSVVGFEITKTYTKKTAKKIRDQKNARVFVGNGYECFTNLFPSNSVDIIYILFPDPWHKKRHHKRRPINPQWLIDARKRLAPDGVIYFASDWDEYYDFVLGQFREANAKTPIFKLETGEYEPQKQGLTPTHYYEKWKEMGRTFDYIKATAV